jgi:hypothetical protein
VEEIINAYKILTCKLLGKELLGKCIYRGNNMKLYLMETGCENMNWTEMAQNKVKDGLLCKW